MIASPIPSGGPLARFIDAARALFKPPLDPAAAIEDQVRALGCLPLPLRGVARSREPTVQATIDPSAQKPQSVFCVLFDVDAEADNTLIQLRGRDGSVI